MLERDAIARRPFAGHDPGLDIVADALVQMFHAAFSLHARMRAKARGSGRGSLSRRAMADRFLPRACAATIHAIDAGLARRRRRRRRSQRSTGWLKQDPWLPSHAHDDVRATAPGRVAPDAPPSRLGARRPAPSRRARVRSIDLRAAASTFRARCSRRWLYSNCLSSPGAVISMFESEPDPEAPAGGEVIGALERCRRRDWPR